MIAMPLFAVINTRGPPYRHGAPMESQEAWRPHAAFVNALVDDGFVLLGGPLEEPDVLLIIRAESADEIHARLAPDPWHRMRLLRSPRQTRVEPRPVSGRRTGSLTDVRSRPTRRPADAVC
jgi:hypothetical protein